MRLVKKPWMVALVTVVLLTVMVRAGIWQLSRAQEKVHAQQLMQMQMGRPAIVLEQLPLYGNAEKDWLEANRYRSVVLTGHWEDWATVFLDNRQMQKKPGFYVLSPFRLASGEGWVMVQRGWVGRDFQNREHVQMPLSQSDLVTISGVLDNPPAQLWSFDDSALDPESWVQWSKDASVSGLGVSRIRQNIDLAAFSQGTELHVYPTFSVRQSSQAADGLLRDWPQVGGGEQTHYGYAVQWFSFSALLAGLYVWFQVIRPRKAAGA